VARLQQPTHRRGALTFGAQGAWLTVEGAAPPCRPAVQVVDTVGAGDTFWGTCLADWLADPAGAPRPRWKPPCGGPCGPPPQLQPRRLPAPTRAELDAAGG
jgi:fructokinase